MMDRRRFLLTSLAGAVAMPLGAEGQQAGKVWRIGYVVAGAAPNALNSAFIRALPGVGLIEGKNVIVERRYMGGREGQYAEVLVDLERTMDVIVVTGPPAALAAKRVVTKVPVIFAAVGDPVGIPALRQVEDAARQLRVTVQSFDVRRPDDFDTLFAQIHKANLDGLLVIGGPVNVIHQKRIVEFAAVQKLPVISISRDYVDEGGLMSYGPSLAANMAYMVHSWTRS